MKKRSIFQSPEADRTSIYSELAIKTIRELTHSSEGSVSRDEILADPKSFEDVEVIFSGWGAELMDEALLQALPNLKAYFYAAGSVRGFVTDAFWQRQILLTSCYRLNAIPVAEFTVATIILSLKKYWHFTAAMRCGEAAYAKDHVAGMYYGARVGIISLGAIGKLVSQRLVCEHQVDLVAYDPFVSDHEFKQLGIQRASDLSELFSTCDVVSLHAPWLKETENLIGAELLRAMPKGATFINTSRGMIVNESEMIEVLRERPDLHAVLDLVRDEEHTHLSPLAKMRNVSLTPHIAGSAGLECQRMGDQAVEELRRYLAGQPPLCALTKESAARLA